eukprot:1845446-Karenia_brevis.AAC.1
MDSPPALVKWNRLIIMHQVAQHHALTGTILNYLEELRVETENKAYEEYVTSNAETMLTNIIWGYGSPMSRSTTGPV